MTTVQAPPSNGPYLGEEIRTFEEGMVHIGAETVVLGINVVVSAKACRRQGGEFGIFRLETQDCRKTQPLRNGVSLAPVF